MAWQKKASKKQYFYSPFFFVRQSTDKSTAMQPACQGLKKTKKKKKSGERAEKCWRNARQMGKSMGLWVALWERVGRPKRILELLNFGHFFLLFFLPLSAHIINCTMGRRAEVPTCEWAKCAGLKKNRINVQKSGLGKGKKNQFSVCSFHLFA